MTTQWRVTFDRGVGRITSEPSASSFLGNPGRHERNAKSKLGKLFHDFEARNFDIRRKTDAAFQKEVLGPTKSHAVALIEQEVLFLQIGRCDFALFGPWMQGREK